MFEHCRRILEGFLQDHFGILGRFSGNFKPIILRVSKGSFWDFLGDSLVVHRSFFFDSLSSDGRAILTVSWLFFEGPEGFFLAMLFNFSEQNLKIINKNKDGKLAKILSSLAISTLFGYPSRASVILEDSLTMVCYRKRP